MTLLVKTTNRCDKRRTNEMLYKGCEQNFDHFKSNNIFLINKHLFFLMIQLYPKITCIHESQDYTTEFAFKGILLLLLNSAQFAKINRLTRDIIN